MNCSCSMQYSTVCDMRSPTAHRPDCPVRIAASVSIPFSTVLEERTAFEQRIAELEAESTRLRASLERYGQHAETCPAYPAGSGKVARCTCGYHAALAANGLAASGEHGTPAEGQKEPQDA